MYKKKVYGSSRNEYCPMCGKNATTKNGQGLPMCRDCKDFELDLKCACGSWLDIKESKHGVFFVCMDCGCVSWSKAMEINGLDG